MDIIPEEKFFVKMVDDSLLPQLIRTVGTRFEPCVNSDGTHGNKRILIYQELCGYVESDIDGINKCYKEVPGEIAYQLLYQEYINKHKR